MIVGAGIDVGNSTTEVVLGEVGSGAVRVVATGRAPTRRAKGSPESLEGAVALVRRLERQHGVRVTTAVAAPLRPVHTATAALAAERTETGRLWVAKASAGTAGGRGVGVGRPVRLGAIPTGSDPLVVVVPAGTGFAAALGGLSSLVTTGRLAAVLLEDDEAVLVANRLSAQIPVLDEVDAAAILGAERVAVEVSDGARPLQTLPDPLKLATALGLTAAETGDAARLAPQLLDVSNAVVALGGSAPVVARTSGGWMDVRGPGRLPFLQGHERVKSGTVGLACAYALPPADTPYAVDDLWTVDLAAVAATVQARGNSTHSRPVSLAALRADAPDADPSRVLSERLGVPVQLAPSEATSARRGGLSTPGAAVDAVVADLGGGTIDVVSATASVVAAGGGELLTVSVAALAGMSGAAAEWVKRGPAYRVDTPQILQAEDSTRRFLDHPAAPETVGSLVVEGPAGLLPFSQTMAPGEWRALRLRLKIDLVGGNVARAVRTLDTHPRTVVIVGGPAGDDEILAAVGGALPAGTAVARGDVAGSLGHRFAVAYGLLALAAEDLD